MNLADLNTDTQKQPKSLLRREMEADYAIRDAQARRDIPALQRALAEKTGIVHTRYGRRK